MKRLPLVASYQLKCGRSSIRHEIYQRTRVLENMLNNDRRQFARLSFRGRYMLARHNLLAKEVQHLCVH